MPFAFLFITSYNQIKLISFLRISFSPPNLHSRLTLLLWFMLPFCQMNKIYIAQTRKMEWKKQNRKWHKLTQLCSLLWRDENWKKNDERMKMRRLYNKDLLLPSFAWLFALSRELYTEKNVNRTFFRRFLYHILFCLLEHSLLSAIRSKS